ncbi:MAG: LamG domain-containing protein [Candidatus Nezhaarchaeales archaeon]
MAGTASRVLRTGGLYFDGVDDYVATPLVPSPNQSFTLIVWAKSNIYISRSERLGKALIATLSTWANDTIFFWWAGWGGGWDILIDIGGTDYHASCPTDLDTDWHFVVATFDSMNGVLKLYVDGVLGATRTGIPQPNFYPAPFKISCYHYWNGLIDDVRIYNRALSDDEIKAIYERDELIKDGLVLYLDFTEYEGNIAYDKSGMGNHGTIYGGARWVVKKALRVLPKAG